MMEVKQFVPLIYQAQNGDQEALWELLNAFNLLIIKHSCRYTTQINEDCYQELNAQLIHAIHSFDLKRYKKE